MLEWLTWLRTEDYTYEPLISCAASTGGAITTPNFEARSRRRSLAPKNSGRADECDATTFVFLLSYQPQAGPTPIPTGPIPTPKLTPGA
jgi:hypothetical protein